MKRRERKTMRYMINMKRIEKNKRYVLYVYTKVFKHYL